MATETPITGDMEVIVDTNVFFSIGRPKIRNTGPSGLFSDLPVYHANSPKRVVGELGGPETDRVRAALKEGWAEIIEPPPPSDGDAAIASDITRRTIAGQTGRPEHEIEKADSLELPSRLPETMLRNWWLFSLMTNQRGPVSKPLFVRWDIQNQLLSMALLT